MLIWGQYLKPGHGESFQIFSNSLFITILTLFITILTLFITILTLFITILTFTAVRKYAAQSTLRFFDDASQNLTKLNQYEKWNILINYKHH